MTKTPTRSISVGCDEESFSFPEELRLVALYEDENKDENEDEDDNDNYTLNK